MYTIGSRKTTTSEVKRKKLQAVNAFWDNSASLYLQIIVGIQEACTSINTPFLIFCYLYLHSELLDNFRFFQAGTAWKKLDLGTSMQKEQKLSMLAQR